MCKSLGDEKIIKTSQIEKAKIAWNGNLDEWARSDFFAKY